ncbi:MAG: hypothetical protein ACREVJ_09300, partial [Gammaproteobacteria bacterium]
GPDGTPVAGPSGYHRMEHTPGVASGTTNYFDAQNREIPSFRPDAFIPIIYVVEITGIKQPAARAGLQAGDIVWKYGNWSYAEALEAARSKGTEPGAMLGAVQQAWLAERDRLSAEPAPMTVLRNDKPVTVTMPPLPEKTIGMQFEDRTVPIDTFEDWKAAEARQGTGSATP